MKTICGGSWLNLPVSLRSAGRHWLDTDGRANFLGFRLVGRPRINSGRRVIRGGSWFGKPGNLRSTLRFGDDTGVRLSLLGFRMVGRAR